MTRDPNVIETQALAKRYAGGTEAVHSLDLTVPRNQITGFLGRNGAGKSTTIKMLLGMIHPTAGVGKLLGRRIDNSKENCAARGHVAYVAEDKQLYAYLTVGEMIKFTRSFYDDWRPEMEERLLRRYELPRNRRVKALSKGMRTKLALLLALARRPELLILDEPSEGLDPVAIEDLLQALVAAAGEGTTVFFSSHQIAEVERIADRVCIIDHGHLLVQSSMDEMRSNYRRITAGFTHQPAAADFQLPGIASVTTSGRQIALLASHGADAIVARAHNLNATSVDVSPVSLREIFLETVKGPA
jgi:ABC-2 type transport system ATP-binding protein